MIKTVVILLSILTSTVSKGYCKMETINTDNILYSMPTISGNKITYVMPTRKSFTNAPQFHEDEWCQLQFFHKSQLEDIKSILSEYKKFELSHRRKYGWSDIYVRKVNIDNIHVSMVELTQILSTKTTPPPILTTSSKPLGQVKDGFSLRTKSGVLLYGIESNGKIKSLCSILESNTDNISLTKVFNKLNREKNLILVDWRQQFILVSVDSKDNINIWNP